MIIYSINLCVSTKNTDRYDRVAVNKYPMIIKCNNIMELKEYLSNDDTSKFIKNLLKHKHLYEDAVFFIREINKNDIKEFQWKTEDINKIDYNKENEEE